MNVLILGAGAMGSLIGARLASAGTQVCLVGASPDKVNIIRQKGITIEELDGSTSLCYPEIYPVKELAWRKRIDLVIVLVKAPDTREAIRGIQDVVGEGTVFLTLQNGVGHWESIAEVMGSERLLIGTTSQGATLLEPGKIRHGGKGPTYIGAATGEGERFARSVVELFNRAGLEAYYSPDIETKVWQKLMVNVGINAITAIAGVPNGWIVEQENARELAREAVLEALAVAQRKGIDLPENTVERVYAVAKATAINRSSMNQDLAGGRPTEIDVINGAVVRYGRQLGIATPVNWTLVQLVRIIEEKQRREGSHGQQ